MDDEKSLEVASKCTRAALEYIKLCEDDKVPISCEDMAAV